ncbi:MAG TPA: hypothetical protein VHZ73_03275 [Vicinamibacterales bacterium]|nr:hypothetical protein [Vicinamibacterales bacterium]
MSDRFRLNSDILSILLVPAGGYLAWQYFQPFWTGEYRVDGIVGVLIGLYICSYPSANGIDLIFAERGNVKRIFTKKAGFVWLSLNAIVMMVGWFVIVIGASRFTGGGPTFPLAPVTPQAGQAAPPR